MADSDPTMVIASWKRHVITNDGGTVRYRQYPMREASAALFHTGATQGVVTTGAASGPIGLAVAPRTGEIFAVVAKGDGLHLLASNTGATDDWEEITA